MGHKHKSFPEGNGSSGEVKELKQKIRRLESDKKRLISELKTLQAAFDKSREFISKKVTDISLEDLTRMSNKTLKQIEEVVACKSCGGQKFTFMTLPNNNKLKICTNCKHRETIHDSNQFDSVEEVV